MMMTTMDNYGDYGNNYGIVLIFMHFESILPVLRIRSNSGINYFVFNLPIVTVTGDLNLPRSWAQLCLELSDILQLP